MGHARALRLTAMAAALAAGFVAAAVPAAAQTSRIALDTVVAADGGAGSQVTRRPSAWFDVFGAVRLAEGLDLRVRPVVFRRSFDGAWNSQIYELALRYERSGRVGWRFDAGQFASPVGLSILENRPNRNPVVSQHSTLYLPVVRYEAGTPASYLLAASYPFGLQVTASAATWDVRAAVTDSSPIRGRPVFGDNLPPRMVNLMLGGGFTPRVGLRFGAAVARGAYAAAHEVRDPSRGDRIASLVQVEGEWSFGYTRLAGEWLWTSREMAAGAARVDGGWVEATQTLGPRWFAAARYDDQRTKWRNPAEPAPRSDPYRRLETTLGFRAAPEVTLRLSYMTRKGYVVSFWDDQMLASVVFAKKLK
jgi:hypothetical protein